MAHISSWFMLMMLIYWEGAYVLKENTEPVVAASREIGLEVNADETKYMVMSRDQNTGRNQNVKNENNSFERVEELKYLRKT